MCWDGGDVREGVNVGWDIVELGIGLVREMESMVDG